MNAPTPETLTLQEARELCAALYARHNALCAKAGFGPLGAYCMDTFGACLSVMEMHIREIEKLEASLCEEEEAKREICALAKEFLP